MKAENKIKLNWIQSDFIPNCPIYNVYAEKGNISFLRIEYLFASVGWSIKFMHFNKFIGGGFHDAEVIKLEAEKFMIEKINKINLLYKK